MRIYGFNDLAKVNSELKTTDIRGKEYAAVAERIRAFRKLCPDGQIVTEFIKLDDGFAVCRAAVSIFDEEGRQKVIGTGTAYEKEGSTNINRTSYIENCETSAVGRALGMAGFGLLGDVATADEVNRAAAALDAIKTEEVRRQEIGIERAVALSSMLRKNGITDSFICEKYKVRSLDRLTEAQHKGVVNNIDKFKEAYDSEQQSKG